MLSPVVIGALIQTGIVVILCVGFTFTYMVEKFPNFAHTGFATLGVVTTHFLVRVYDLNPYQVWPITMFSGGLVGILMYFLIVRPIRATGAREISLTFAFFVVTQIISSVVNMYSYWFLYSQHYPTAGFRLLGYDFTFLNMPGVLSVSLITSIILVLGLYWFLYRAKHGIALRAVSEDEQLAASLGVNVVFIHYLSWFITGSLAGLAGGIIPLWRYTGLGFSDEFLVIVMAGSVVGGLHSLTGAVVGGVFVATAQKVLNQVFIMIYGIGAGAYEPLLPIVFIFVFLMLEPDGLVGLYQNPHHPKETLLKIMHDIRSGVKEIMQSPYIRGKGK